MTTETARLGLTKATYGSEVGTWDVFERQDRDRLEDRLSTQFAGSPVGNVAGYWEGQRCTDTTNDLEYICTATGPAASASWVLLATRINALGNIDDLVALTAPAIDDLFAVWDLSASGNRAISFANALNVVTGLTALTASDTDLSNDLIYLYDTSASQVKKGTPQNFSGIDPIAYSARALSASFAVSFGSQISFTHALGARAKGAQAWFKNLSTEGGFSASETFLASQYFSTGMRGVGIAIVDDTTVKANIGAVAGVWNTLDGTSNFTMTASNWAIIIEAWT